MRSRTLMWAGGLSGSLAVLAFVVTACSGDDGVAAPDSGSPDTGTDTFVDPDTGTGDPDAGADADAGPNCTSTPCVVDLAAGNVSTCAVLVDGTVRCWGANFAGELGIPPDEYRHSKPMPVPDVTGAAELVIGGYFGQQGYACALLANGGVSCWGRNTYQKLGRLDASLDTFYGPGAVDGVEGAIQLSAGPTHGCVIVADGGVRCWGNNAQGQLGRLPMTTSGAGLLPDFVQGLPGAATSTAASGAHTCVLLSDGRVACFGGNSVGQLGQLDAGEGPSPFIVPNLSSVTQLVSRYAHACALIGPTGSVVCWGYNGQGQSGTGMSDLYAQPSLVALPFDRKAVLIGGGEHTTCAVLDDGSLWCWGENSHGATGTPPDAGLVQLIPVRVNGLPAGAKILKIVGGYNHMCVLLDGGSVQCWGSNYFGELGRGDAPPDGEYDPGAFPTPAPVVF